ncbi:hypothetical protein [Paludisphaera mucosa]|uniref:Terminase large subunit gp17-like C-terminal domain-containing protein n=1 Tax=Paludisphaera mucosa TaxID=3030827 RepID=A0ABT6F6M5_9BACT|nr:hypothetical protein [Paludisphaera mucosa]MDG3003231.1 hypothetical protein [Paludisphaera mucosa]
MPTEIRLTLPRPHPGQATILRSTARFNVVDCGRRFGKTVAAQIRIVKPALAGHPTAWFAPEYKFLAEPWDSLSSILRPVVVGSSKQERRIRLLGGGCIDFWSLDDPDSGRSRKYKHVVVDEAAKARYLEAAWTKAIRPTLTDLKGTADFWSTPRGRDYFWKLYVRGEDELEPEYRSFRFPTLANPYIDPAEIEDARRQLPDRVFRQEYLAEFLEDAGGVFRHVADAVDRGRLLPEEPRRVGAYALGVDLARLEDFTVLCVLDQSGRQVYFERFNQIDWTRQVASIKAVAERYRATVVLDASGLGDPIYQQLADLGLAVEPYVLTSASKKPLIDELAMGLDAGKIRLMDVAEQEAELVAYEYQMTKSRNWTANAPEGMHDDCVIALALAYHGCQAVRPSWGIRTSGRAR